MKRSKPKFSRREVLKASAAAGVALSLPWLPGCGGDSSGSGDSTGGVVTRNGRAIRNVQVDLTGFDPAAIYQVTVIGSRRNGARLKVHNAHTRADVMSGRPWLQGLRLTHYVNNVDLPLDRVQRVSITRVNRDGSQNLVRTLLYIPATYLIQVRQLESAGMVGDNPGPVGDLSDLRDINLTITTEEAAADIVFHHPRIVRLDPSQAALVKLIITRSPELLQALASRIEDLGLDWITDVPAVDVEGKPVLDDHGNQIVQWDPSDAVVDDAQSLVYSVLQRVNNELALEGANWHQNPAVTLAQVPKEPAESNGEFEATSGYTSGTINGLIIDSFKIIDQDRRQVQLTVRNTWLRYLGVYAEFFDAANTRVHPRTEEFPSPNPYEHLDLPFQTSVVNLTHACVGIVATNKDYLGIPLIDAHTLPVRLNLYFPKTATSAKMTFGTLGTGGGKFGETGALGSITTIIVNIAMPGLLTAISVGSDSVGTFSDIFKDPGTLFKLLVLLPVDIYFKGVKSQDTGAVLASVGKVALSIVLKAIPPLAQALAVELGSQALAQAVPYIGWGIKLARLTAAAAEIAQTIDEMNSGPAIFENTISLKMNTLVRISHDPDNFQFPATATRYVIRATYDGKAGIERMGTLTTTREDDITELLAGVPAGGKGSIDVWFLTDNHWIAGHGSSGVFVNTPQTASEVAITIKENLVPLTAETQYHHKQSLVVSGNDTREWAPRRDMPPQQTLYDANCNAASICQELDGITVSQSAAMVGYAWRARSTIGTCGGGPSSLGIHRIQNVSLGQRPQSAFKTGMCGYTGTPLIAYELLNKDGQPARAFYLDPTNDGFHLRAITLDKTTPFDQTSRLSWGQFSLPLNSMAFHPTGFMVGVNEARHKLEIVELRDQPLPDADAVYASLKAGLGSRPGLLRNPIAVSVDLMSLAILVLDAGNLRVQAFDWFGNVIDHFDDKRSPEMALRAETGPVRYLDMAVESTGWIYILSYGNDGRNRADYRVDIYNPLGEFVSRTAGVAAARLALDKWRNMYTLNYETIVGARGPEPSVSTWIPSTPDGCATKPPEPPNPFCERTDL